MLADQAAASFFNVNPAVAGSNDLPQQQQQQQYHPWLIAASWVAVIWYLTVTAVALLGWTQLQRHYSSIPKKSYSASLHSPQVPHVTIIRPVKGLEPYLYECLASSIRLNYPKGKLTIYFCIGTTTDPAYPVLKQLLEDFPDADVRIFVEEENDDDGLGPNPKIRNMSRAYREAKSDIVWIVDCNVWVGKGVCGRMVDRLCGIVAEDGTVDKQYRFVHQLPIVVDVGGCESSIENAERQDLLQRGYNSNGLSTETSSLSLPTERNNGQLSSVFARGGGRLEELFLSSSHAKFYSAINTVLIAPCIVGKSTMFRRSHLDYLTSPAISKPRAQPRRPGIDYFSDNICEDHLIGDCLWNGKPLDKPGERWGKHSLVFGDLAVQPVARMSVKAYIHRRVRWLRVRKYTVLAATLVEPGTESFLCSTYLALGLTTLLPHLYPQCASYLSTWAAFFAIWFLSIALWITIDWTLYLKLHSAASIEVDEHTPPFALPLPRFKRSRTFGARRPFHEWFFAWLGREALAFPIWFCAVLGGATVVWRDRKFYVGMDMIAREIPGEKFQSGSYSNGCNGNSPMTGGQGPWKNSYGTVNGGSGEGSMDVRQRSPNTRFSEHLRN
ncbi:hypothetical protein AJ79_03933 [Helicocarpus griseus UAMH5409]|uniref:Ceramide glucosyltransferase n=1 Tax=Helicocarpus griseus UAMH5409 TaxID=1447875 RepID=A0A2B7XVC7_9EURO|nr:hypothetical protein AJ79_03933 [Helicocarpus griseus UAMH5409]